MGPAWSQEVGASANGGLPAAALPASAPAAADPTYRPGAWTVSGWSVTPQLAIAGGFNSNLRAQSAQIIASPFEVVIPDVSAARVDGDDQWQLGWHAEATRFTRSRADDTLNQELSTSGLQVLGPRTALAWHAAWQDWHETLGLADADEAAPTPEHFHAEAVGAVWRHDFGVGDAPGLRLEAEPTLSRKRYLDHRDLTASADADTGTLVLRGLQREDVTHRGGVELRALRTHYPTDKSLLSNTAWRAFGLMQVDAAEGADASPWSGSAAAGLEWRRFDSVRGPYRGAAWDAHAQWNGSPDLAWTFATSRGAADAPGEHVDEVVTTRVSTGVGIDVRTTWHGSLTLSESHDHYVASQLPRDDEVHAVDLQVRHDLARNWQVAVNAGWLQRHSEFEAFGFTRRLWSVVLTGSL